jgi:hypothetical protein
MPARAWRAYVRRLTGLDEVPERRLARHDGALTLGLDRPRVAGTRHQRHADALIGEERPSSHASQRSRMVMPLVSGHVRSASVPCSRPSTHRASTIPQTTAGCPRAGLGAPTPEWPVHRRKRSSSTRSCRDYRCGRVTRPTPAATPGVSRVDLGAGRPSPGARRQGERRACRGRPRSRPRRDHGRQPGTGRR